MPILNYTTTVGAARSAEQVVGILARAGAHAVTSVYDKGLQVGVRFSILTEFGPREFNLPVDTEGVYKALCREAEPRYRSREQAHRVGWRILKDWVEVQLALIAAGMSRLDEVMLPYMLDDSGLTIAELYRQRGQLQLEAAQ